MNNYIPINKAVNPVCIYQGDEPLISKMLGVDEMIYGFDGTPSDYATCVGAPEMFIKVEEDGLYYFGVEADDTGSLTIAGEQAIKKDGTPPNGKLNIETDSRYLKAGYYKVALSWTNNAYTPVSNNAAAFNVTMDREPIQAGKYEGNSTMKREFSPSPKSSRCNEKIFQILGLLVILSLHAPAWGDKADNGIECSVVMEKTSFDPRAAFPDFKLVFVNKGEKAVRLFDDFYPLKERGPNIIIKIWNRGNGKKGERPAAWYLPSYQMERVADLMRFITLNPGEKHEVPVKDAYLLLTCLQPLASGKIYELEVRFRDGYGDPGTRREYVGKKDFIVMDQTPR